MASSSDDSVDEDMLRESIDPSFKPHQKLTDCKQISVTNNIRTNGRKGVSLNRHQLKVSNADHCMNLEVTPGFQDFVSRYLFNFLEKEIEEVDCKVKQRNTNEEATDGIKLFSTSLSNCTLETSESVPTSKKSAMKIMTDSESEDERQMKIASAAVTYDWIIKQNNPTPNQRIS